MKPIKPKKMPENLERWIGDTAASTSPSSHLTIDRKRARTILAALAYERQRAEAALDELAKHAQDFGGTPRGAAFDAFLTMNGRPRAALTDGEMTPDQREQRVKDAMARLATMKTPGLAKLKVRPQRAGPTGTNILTNDGRLVPLAEFQREQTAAVVPKPRWHAAEAAQAAADAINADPNNPLFAKVDGLVITASERNPAGPTVMKLPKRPRRKS